MDPLIIPFVPRRTKDHTHSNHAQKTLRFPMPKQKGARRKIINDMRAAEAAAQEGDES